MWYQCLQCLLPSFAGRQFTSSTHGGMARLSWVVGNTRRRFTHTQTVTVHIPVLILTAPDVQQQYDYTMSCEGVAQSFAYRPKLTLCDAFSLATSTQTKARFPFKRNRLRCVRCVNENRKKTQALALASSQSWLPLLRPSIPIGWRLRLLREKRLRLNGNRA